MPGCDILVFMKTNSLSEELTWRGFVNQTTLSDTKQLDSKKFTLYFGVDPSADSMTVGNLAAAMMVRHFIDHGHKVYLLVGGATGMIGDPGGKDVERSLQTMEQIAHNKEGIAGQYKQVFAGQPFEVVDNYDWLSKLNLLDFLRDTGKHFSMTNLVQRDFIANRMGEGGSGISYTEFSYTLLQGYDFYHLHKEYGVDLQLCGSDQWGNSISGVELIRRKTGDEAHVYSCPLVTNKTTGKKFGKSESGAVWLDPAKTSVYQFYQFWLNADDAGVLDYLKIFTLLSRDKIEEVMAEFQQSPGERLAQKTLAYEVTKIVHGEKAADSAQRVSQTLFGGNDYSGLNEADFELLKSELPVVAMPQDGSLIDVLVEGKLASSKSDARRFLEANAVYVNGQQIPLSKSRLDQTDGLKGHIIVRRGKNAQIIVTL